jgi:hypothetical protein
MENSEVLLAKLVERSIQNSKDIENLRANLSAFQAKVSAAFRHAGLPIDVESSSRRDAQSSIPCEVANKNDAAQIEATLKDFALLDAEPAPQRYPIDPTVAQTLDDLGGDVGALDVDRPEDRPVKFKSNQDGAIRGR